MVFIPLSPGESETQHRLTVRFAADSQDRRADSPRANITPDADMVKQPDYHT